MQQAVTANDMAKVIIEKQDKTSGVVILSDKQVVRFVRLNSLIGTVDNFIWAIGQCPDGSYELQFSQVSPVKPVKAMAVQKKTPPIRLTFKESLRDCYNHLAYALFAILGIIVLYSMVLYHSDLIGAIVASIPCIVSCCLIVKQQQKYVAGIKHAIRIARVARIMKANTKVSKVAQKASIAKKRQDSTKAMVYCCYLAVMAIIVNCVLQWTPNIQHDASLVMQSLLYLVLCFVARKIIVKFL